MLFVSEFFRADTFVFLLVKHQLVPWADYKQINIKTKRRNRTICISCSAWSHQDRFNSLERDHILHSLIVLPSVCCTSVGVKKHKFGFISLLGLRGSSPWDAALAILVTRSVCAYSSWFPINNSLTVAKSTQHSQASLLSQRGSEGTCYTSSERPHLGNKKWLEGWKEADLVQSCPYGWNGKGS